MMMRDATAPEKVPLQTTMTTTTLFSRWAARMPGQADTPDCHGFDGFDGGLGRREAPERDRERERQRETQRERETERDGERERERRRETQRERERRRERERQRETQRERHRLLTFKALLLPWQQLCHSRFAFQVSWTATVTLRHIQPGPNEGKTQAKIEKKPRKNREKTEKKPRKNREKPEIKPRKNEKKPRKKREKTEEKPIKNREKNRGKTEQKREKNRGKTEKKPRKNREKNLVPRAPLSSLAHVASPIPPSPARIGTTPCRASCRRCRASARAGRPSGPLGRCSRWRLRLPGSRRPPRSPSVEVLRGAVHRRARRARWCCCYECLEGESIRSRCRILFLTNESSRACWSVTALNSLRLPSSRHDRLSSPCCSFSAGPYTRLHLQRFSLQAS
ncbi:uncharacterized protein LOC144738760 [Lampetra planeri]